MQLDFLFLDFFNCDQFRKCPSLFLQHTHYPQFAGWKSVGRSLRGPFGDALLEFDSTVGDILRTLKKTGILNNTLVFFTADNG